jgi:hypothetical protein
MKLSAEQSLIGGVVVIAAWLMYTASKTVIATGTAVGDSAGRAVSTTTAVGGLAGLAALAGANIAKSFRDYINSVP